MSAADMQYTMIIFLAVFSMVIMSRVVRYNDLLDTRKKRQFIAAFLIVILAAVSEWTGNYLNGRMEGLRLLHILAKAADHTLSPVIAMIFAGIMTNEKTAKRLLIPLLVHGILECISGWLGFIYTVDTQNIYHHGSCYWIYVVFYLFCSIYFLVAAWKFGRKYQTNSRVILELTLAFLVVGLFSSMIWSEVRVSYITISIDAIIVYIYYTEVIEKTDILTGLLNRRSYESHIRNLREASEILFFDVDEFKEINDTYGHSVGDLCLERVGHAILRSYGNKGNCYRIGGDEFCVILNRNLDSVTMLNHAFAERMNKEREKDKRIPYVSVGHAFFDPEKNDIESAVNEADKQMYYWKQKRKSERNHIRQKHSS